MAAFVFSNFSLLFL